MGEAEPRVVGASVPVLSLHLLLQSAAVKAVSTAGCRIALRWFASHVGRMSWIHSDG